MVMLDICTILVAVRRGPKRRDFDNLLAKPDVRKPKPPADQAAVAKQRPDLLRMGIGSNVEILGMQPKQCVAHAASDQECLKTRLVQPIQDLERTPGNFFPGYVMGGARTNFGTGFLLGPAFLQYRFRLEIMSASLIIAAPSPSGHGHCSLRLAVQDAALSRR